MNIGEETFMRRFSHICAYLRECAQVDVCRRAEVLGDRIEALELTRLEYPYEYLLVVARKR
jgi:hypothetical protein